MDRPEDAQNAEPDAEVEEMEEVPEKPVTPAAPMMPKFFAQSPSGVAASTVEATQKAATAVKAFTASNTGRTVALLVVGIAVAFAVAYLIYWLIDRTVNNRAKYVMKASKLPIVATTTTVLNDDDAIPSAGNGKRSSLSFWIYIYDLNKFQGVDRHVLHRGEETSTFETAGPYVVLDKASNKLHITYAPSSPDNLYKYNNNIALNPVGTTGGLQTKEHKARACRILRGITIDYVPIQRWVHVAVVVNEEVNGGSITAYVDGELVKNVNSRSTYTKDPTNDGDFYNIVKYKDTSVDKKMTLGLDIANADLDRKGHVYVGGSTSSAGGPGFSGMVSKVSFFNYDMNAKDVYQDYLGGPVDSMMAKLGYGLRSPVYKMA